MDYLGKDEHDNPVSCGLSRGLGELIGTVLHLTRALVMLRGRITEVALRLDWALTRLVPSLSKLVLSSQSRLSLKVLVSSSLKNSPSSPGHLANRLDS